MRLDINHISLIVIIASIAVALYPFVYLAVAGVEVGRIFQNLHRIEFALRHFFYVEGFGIIAPSSVRVETLVDRYYLKESPGREYGIAWLDPDPSDGEVTAVVFYDGYADPAIVLGSGEDYYWYDPKTSKIYKSFRPGRKLSLVVEVRGD